MAANTAASTGKKKLLYQRVSMINTAGFSRSTLLKRGFHDQGCSCDRPKPLQSYFHNQRCGSKQVKTVVERCPMANNTAASAGQGHYREVSVIRATDAAGQSRSGYIFTIKVKDPTSQGRCRDISTTNTAALAGQERHREISMISDAASTLSGRYRGATVSIQSTLQIQPAEGVIKAFR